MVSHKRKKKEKFTLILLALLLITLFSSFQINTVQASTTLNFAISNDIILDEEEGFTPDETFNLRNITTITQANLSDTTESFTGDAGGNPTGWEIWEGTGCTVDVEASRDDHYEILELYDNSGGSDHFARAVKEYETIRQIQQTIDFWVSMDGGTENRYFNIYEETDLSTANNLLTIQGGDFYNQDSEDIGDYVNDVWYHFSIYVDTNLGVYSVDINGVEASALDSMNMAMNWANAISYSTRGWAGTNYYLYVDAVHISFEDDISNFLPTETTTNDLEIDKHDFMIANSTSFFKLEESVDDPQGWISTTTGNNVVHHEPEIPNNNLVILFDEQGSGFYDSNLIKNFSTEEGYFNITWKVNYKMMEDDLGGEFLVKVNSFDETLLTEINIKTDGVDSDVRYYDGSSYIEIETESIEEGEDYDFNLFFDDHPFAILDIKENGVRLNRHIIPLITISAGIGTINVTHIVVKEIPDVCNIVELDYIGVYVNGTSLYNNGFGYHTIHLNQSWNFKEHNLFTLNASGTFSLIAINNASEIFEDYGVLFEDEYFNSTEEFFNIYDGGEDFINASLFMIFNETNILANITSILIEGVKFTQGSNEYYIDFTHSGVDISESYFYASGSSLYYTLLVDDGDPEWIQAEINIIDLPSENRSASFLSNINGDSRGFFRAIYSDATSSNLEFPTWSSTTTVILPQTKTIESFAILITDNDEDTNDVCTGVITTIQLIYITGVQTTIVTLNLMMVIVPIMVLLVPTFGIAARYGKNTILPIFILMAIICFATNLIPVWLFFIIMLSAGGFLFMKRKGANN